MTDATTTTETTSTTHGVLLTDVAATKVKSLLEQEGRDDLRLRIGVQPGGCSGLIYQLYFDENERLIFALDRTARPEISRIELLTRYPRALRVQQSDSFDQFQVDVQPCITMTALVDRKRDHVVQFGYAWTCQTKSLASRTGPPSEHGDYSRPGGG